MKAKKDPSEKVKVRSLYLPDTIWLKCVAAARAGGFGGKKTDGTAVSHFLADVVGD